MSLESINDVFRRISTLREVDSIIDLARGWLQFRILIALGFLRRSDVNNLSNLLGERKKAVLDALRKLRLKNLITDVEGGIYVTLSDEGRKLYDMILSVISNEPVVAGGMGSPTTSEDIHRDLTKYFYLYDTIIALGSSRNYELPLTTLSSIVKLSPTVLDDYLKPYTDGRLELLRRKVISKRFSLSSKEVIYKLSDDGIKVYHRLPDYVKYKGDVKASILRALTRSGHPRIVLKRLSLILSLGSAFIAITTTVLPTNLSLIIVMSWVLIISFLALITEATY